MVYKLVNPSDPYTFKADTYEAAALAVLCLGTQYGASPKSGDENVPVFLFVNAEELYKDAFSRTIDEGLKANREYVADALSSMLYGGFEERETYEMALESITDAEKENDFKEKWHDRHSSLNDIGLYAQKMAKVLRGADNDRSSVSSDN